MESNPEDLLFINCSKILLVPLVQRNLPGTAGAAMKLELECVTCENTLGGSWTSPSITDKSQRPAHEINRRMVDAFPCNGMGNILTKNFGAIVKMNVIQETAHRDHMNKYCIRSITI